MHPTQLDVDYMKRVIKKAAEYRVDSFEICAKCHSPLGGLDGLADYAPYPTAHGRADLAGIAETREKLNAVLELAHSIGKPVYYWHREAVVPEGLLDDRPKLLDENGEFDLFGEAYAELLRHKIRSAFDAVPALDGLVLTLTEASYSVLHNSDPAKYPPRQVVAHLTRLFASELQARGKVLILRSFGSIAQDYEDILAGAAEAAKEFRFEVETKITPYDFDPFLPTNPFLRKLPGATLGAECDSLGEFLGAGMLPAENVENIVNYVRTGRAAGVDRWAIRLDRHGRRIFDSYEINLYAYERAIADPNVTADDIRREWLDAHAPASARTAFADLGKMGLEAVLKTIYIDGNAILHQSAASASMKFLKAGFIFALFKDGVSLRNGAGVWSILSSGNTPGRDAILREKQQAAHIVSRGLALMNSLSAEPGYAPEYRWRRELWENAEAAALAFLYFTRAVCAYFDDMEAGAPAAAKLTAGITEAKVVLNMIQPTPAAPLRRKTYIDSFTALIGQLADEYRTEFAMRQKYRPGTLDCAICGAITDEWRFYRYMHASHVGSSEGEFFRFAGNKVFPNGFIEVELERPENGGKVVVHGDTAETALFRIALDGKGPVDAVFDARGIAEFPVARGGKTVKVRITKAPGAFYPRIRAVATIGK